MNKVRADALNQKGLGVIYILVGVLILSFVAGGIYYLGKSNGPKSSTSVVSQTPQPTLPPAPDETASWKIYSDTKVNYSFKYPVDGEIKHDIIPSLLSIAPIAGVVIEPPYQEPYSKWYRFVSVVGENTQNLDAKTAINNYVNNLKQNCSPPACSAPKMILDTLKPYVNGDINGYIFHNGSETDSVWVVQSTKNYIYIFTMTGDQGNITDYGSKMLDQMLSTLKFTQ